MRKIFLIISIFCTLAFSAMSQNEGTSAKENPSDIKSFKQEIGLAAGATTGMGLSYRAWYKKIGVQASFLPVISQSNNWISSGLTFIYKIRDNRSVNFFIYEGNHVITKSKWETKLINSYNTINIKTQETSLNIGLGIGFEFPIKEFFGLNILGGYGIYDLTNKWETRPTGEIGLFYKF